MRTEILKQLLQIENPSKKEKDIKDYIISMCIAEGYEYSIDQKGNMTIHKHKTGDTTPYLIAHLDSVIVRNFNNSGIISIEQYDQILFGMDTEGERANIGGDDKAGVFICLELLKYSEKPLSVILFVEEEIGMLGSKNYNFDSIRNASYYLSYDAPGRKTLPITIYGRPIFHPASDFFYQINPILISNGLTNFQQAPWTDSLIVSQETNVQLIHLPCGYYGLHSTSEIVHIPSVKTAIKNGLEILSTVDNSRVYRLTDASTHDVPHLNIVSGNMEELSI